MATWPLSARRLWLARVWLATSGDYFTEKGGENMAEEMTEEKRAELIQRYRIETGLALPAKRTLEETRLADLLQRYGIPLYGQKLSDLAKELATVERTESTEERGANDDTETE